MSGIVYLNGALIPDSQAKVSVMDYGFLYGFGLFETMRAYKGQVFLLDRHLRRLADSAKTLEITDEIPELRAVVMDILRANRLSNARIRITISKGEGGISPEPGACQKPSVLVYAAQYQPYSRQVYQQGFKAIVSSIRRNSLSSLSRLKSVNYLGNLLAKQEAVKAGVDEAICLNEKGLIAESSMSNIFLVNDGELQTPKEENGILPGITREVVLQLASQLNITAIEKDIKLNEFFRGQEAFLTNSLIEIMPLTEIGGMPVGSGRAGPVTQKLMTEYKKLVRASSTI